MDILKQYSKHSNGHLNKFLIIYLFILSQLNIFKTYIIFFESFIYLFSLSNFIKSCIVKIN